jgi:isoleucyl-tRNA synthetase
MKLLAPVLPFVTEEIYQNLVRNTNSAAAESIHLNEFPIANEDYIDQTLMKEVDALKKLVELGRSARNKANLKIRQPLEAINFWTKDDTVADFFMDQKALILDELNVKVLKRVDNTKDLIVRQIKPNLAILGQKLGKDLPLVQNWLSEQEDSVLVDELNEKGSIKANVASKDVYLTTDELLIESVSADDVSSAEGDGLVVGVNTKLTNELIQEGIVRDLIRQVQLMRKNADFAVEDRIIIFGKFDGEIKAAVDTNHEYFLNETLTMKIDENFQEGEYYETLNIRGNKTTLGIARVNKD